MRSGLLWTLTLGMGLVLATLAEAEEPAPTGNWFGRWFSFGKTGRKKHAEPADDDPVIAPVNKVNVRKQALAAWQRRTEACLQLQTIAAATNDDELKRKADLLNQRAWELYLKRAGPAPTTSTQLDEQILQRGLGASRGANQVSSRAEPAARARTAAREE